MTDPDRASSPSPEGPPQATADAPGAVGAAPGASASGGPAHARHPVDPSHDLSDSPAHARSPAEYTAPPGERRRGPEGPALDVGG